MPYWNCYYHITWGTNHRQAWITSQIEPLIMAAIEQKSAELRCPILALNSVADHIHVAVCITPSVSVSTWVGHTKGLSAHAVNAALPNLERPFQWQSGYGVVTFAEKSLSYIQTYIADQKQHHAAGSTVQRLEQIEDD